MQFASDNWAGAHPLIVESVTREAGRNGAAYGGSDADRRIEQRFSDLFGGDVSIFLVGTGTAANGLALAAVTRPGGIVICHRESHIEIDECGGIAHQGDGLRLKPLAGSLGKIAAEVVAAEIATFRSAHIHAGQLAAVSLTQATEAGTVYDAAEVRAISTAARAAGLPLHMDGARFANALVALGLSPAEMTVEAGVDILSFGATKNGCINAEAVIVFRSDLAPQLPYLRMRAGHLFSKTRFIAAQFEAYLKDGLWLELARHANGMADRLRTAIAASGRARLSWPTTTNEVFAVLKRADATRLREKGAAFHDWSADAVAIEDDETVVRLVASFQTTREEVDRLASLVGA